MRPLLISNQEKLSSLKAILQRGARDIRFANNLLAESLGPEDLSRLLKSNFPYVKEVLRSHNRFKDEGNRHAKLTSIEFNRILMRCGFDESMEEGCFLKPYKSQEPYDWDYIGNYLHTHSLRSFNAYKVYNRIFGGDLGTYSGLPALVDPAPKTWIELMSGTAKAAFSISHDHPHLQMVLVDSDPRSFTFNKEYPWAHTNLTRIAGDVTRATTFKSIQKVAQRRGAIIFIGKCSYSCIPAAHFRNLIQNCVATAQHTVLETVGVEPSWTSAEATDMTPPLLRKLGASVVLTVPGPVNPILGTSHIAIEMRGRRERRTLFSYEWAQWHPSSICRMAYKLGCNVRAYDSGGRHFVPVNSWAVLKSEPAEGLLLCLSK